MSSRTGSVKFWKKESGYGFIIDEATKEEIFVHHSGTKSSLTKGDQVSFDLAPGKKGDNAVNVVIVG